MVLIDYGKDDDAITVRDVLLYLVILAFILLVMRAYDLVRVFVRKASVGPREAHKISLADTK